MSELEEYLTVVDEPKYMEEFWKIKRLAIDYALIVEQFQKLLGVYTTTEALEKLAATLADVERFKKAYYDVADAIAPESKSTEHLCEIARKLRQDLCLSELALEEQIKINSALLQELDAKQVDIDRKRKIIDNLICAGETEYQNAGNK